MRTDLQVLDGGLATELAKLGFLIDQDPLWSARVLATSPESVKKVHLDFLKSGATVIATASYQASINGFQKHLGCTLEEAKNIIINSVIFAQKARDKYIEETKSSGQSITPLIAGSVGPYGACLSDGSEYTGNYVDDMSVEELVEWHRPRMQCLVNAGVDLIGFETIPAAKEANALILLLREFPDTKAWLSFSCREPCHTAHGERLSVAVQECLKLPSSQQLVAVGVNCCPPENVESLLHDISSVRKDLPLVAYPNSGEKWISGVGWTGESKSKPLYSYIETWMQEGAKWIGGCCRTSPNDIAAVAKVMALL